MDKVTRYKWRLVDEEPGELLWVDVNEINVDEEYQRNLNEAKVLEIARDFSWPAFGTITVADRDDTYFAIDGWHRVTGAKKRGDIKQVPCIVFQSSGKKEEAEHFLLANTGRKPVTANQKYKALVMKEDENAIFVKGIFAKYGVRLKTTSGEGPRSTKSIAWFLKSAKESKERTEKVTRIASLLCDKHFMHEKLLVGIFYMDKYLKTGVDDRLEKRIIKLGPERLLEGIRKACAFFGRGSEKVVSDGMLQEINKGLKEKFEYK